MQLEPVHMTFGTDPEIFFTNADRAVVGAEKVIPELGLRSENRYHAVVLDGVQAELHPYAHATIKGLAGGMQACFSLISKQLLAKKGQFTVSFAQVVEVAKSELETLSEAARVLGCQPSYNYYRVKPIKVNRDFPQRSAAGHMHLGMLGDREIFNPHRLVDYRKSLVPLLDILVGIPLTILDRDPDAAIRRKLYGRAGEFRLPKYGLEYRTPSNLWMRGGLPMMELAFGLAGTAVSALHCSLKNERLDQNYFPEKELLDVIDLKAVERTINRSSINGAMKLWQPIKNWLIKHPPIGDPNFPIHAGNIRKVNKMFELAAHGKLESFFPTDPVTNWQNLDVNFGLDAFLNKLA